MADADARMDRRRFIAGSAALVGVSLLPLGASATPAEVDALVKEVFGDREVESGRVTLKVPPISENGYSVPLTVEVDSPMTPEDHVLRIALFAEKNPQPNVARFTLGPWRN